MEKIIQDLNDKMSAAYGARDFDEITAMYTDDCQVMPAGFPTVRGPKDVGEFWKGGVSDTLNTMILQAEEVWGPMQDGQGETAIEKGVCSFNNKQGEETAKCKYIVIWKKVAETWKVFLDIWNSDK